MRVDIVRYTGKAILVSFAPCFVANSAAALTSIGILLCESNCSEITIRPNRIQATILLDENDVPREYAAGLTERLQGYAMKRSVVWDFVDDPSQRAEAMSFSVKVSVPACDSCGHSSDVWQWDGMTYNVAPMFRLAGFYDLMKSGFERKLDTGDDDQAAVPVPDILPLAEAGLADMEANPANYEALIPPNGWGDFRGALEFTRALVNACHMAPAGELRFWG